MGERRLGVRLRRAGGLMGRHSWEVVVVVLKFPILLKTSNVMETTSKTPKNNAGFWCLKFRVAILVPGFGEQGR